VGVADPLSALTGPMTALHPTAPPAVGSARRWAILVASTLAQAAAAPTVPLVPVRDEGALS
jgi:hypothetical protein